jgi:hypothetical protein
MIHSALKPDIKLILCVPLLQHHISHLQETSKSCSVQYFAEFWIMRELYETEHFVKMLLRI